MARRSFVISRFRLEIVQAHLRCAPASSHNLNDGLRSKAIPTVTIAPVPATQPESTSPCGDEFPTPANPMTSIETWISDWMAMRVKGFVPPRRWIPLAAAPSSSITGPLRSCISGDLTNCLADCRKDEVSADDRRCPVAFQPLGQSLASPPYLCSSSDTGRSCRLSPRRQPSLPA